MLNAASNPLANWLWKDLYVWPQGRLSRSAYLGALFRILIVYVLLAQILAIFGASLTNGFQGGGAPDLFRGMAWGQAGALLLIAFPAWSVFQRRANDFRPDFRQKLSNWIVAFPLIFAGLLGVAMINTIGYGFILPDFDLGDVRRSFAIMLIGAAFIPGGDIALVSRQAAKPEPGLPPEKGKMAARQMAAGRIASKPAGRHLSASHFDRPRTAPVVPSSPVVQRSYNLPEQGRVKPGWFS